MKTIKSMKKWPFILILAGGIFTVGCGDMNQEIDLVNNEEQREEVFNQILTNRELSNEFLMEMRNSPDAMTWAMENSDFTHSMFGEENMNHMWDSNPGMDTMMINHMNNRMDRDTGFEREFNHRMEERNMMNQNQ